MSIIIPLALLIPNGIFLKLKPINIPKDKEEPGKLKQLFEMFERVGQTGIFIIPLLYKIDIKSIENKVILFIMVVLLLIYYGCWARFFLNQRKFALLFKPLWIIPIPMAIVPIMYMLFASKILNSYLLLIVTLVFGIGHIPISYINYKNTSKIKV